MIQAGLISLAAHGFASSGLWVLTGNAPARRFYEAMGGRSSVSRTDSVGGLARDEISYLRDHLTEYRA